MNRYIIVLIFAYFDKIPIYLKTILGSQAIIMLMIKGKFLYCVLHVKKKMVKNMVVGKLCANMSCLFIPNVTIAAQPEVCR